MVRYPREGPGHRVLGRAGLLSRPDRPGGGSLGGVAVSRLLLLFAVLLCMVGCASQLEGPKAALAAVATAYNEVAPRLEERRRADGRDCMERPAPADLACLEEVRRAWAPARKGVEAVYAALLAATLALHTADAAEAMGRGGVDMARVVRLVLEAVAAVEAMRGLEAPASPVPAPLPPKLPAPTPAPPLPFLRRVI